MEGFAIAVAAFIVVTIVVGVLAGKLVQKSGKRLIVAGKSLPLFMVGTMLAAQAVDGNSTLGNIALVFEFGFWAGAVIPIGLGVCLLLVSAFYAKPLNKMSMITLPDFYFRRYGNGAEGISSILMIISFLILVAGNLAACGFILEIVFGIDYSFRFYLCCDFPGREHNLDKGNWRYHGHDWCYNSPFNSFMEG